MRFPDIPMFRGVNAPSRIEVDLDNLEVDGELPADLDGAFYRVAPDHQFPPRFLDDVPFNADGSVSVFRFKDGRVSLRHRYVRTERFKAERAAGRALFGKYRNPFTDDPSVQGVSRNLANTNPVVFAGKLLALREDSPPVAMDPLTLETLDTAWDFGGTLPGPTFTAHPKIDPETGQMIAFGYTAKGLFSKDVCYYEISPEGRVTHSVWFELPYHCMLHDWGVTRDYVVFPVIPSCGVGEELLKEGKPHYAWDPSKPIHLGVLPRGGEAKDLRWFTAPTQFCSHVMNAFNDGTKIHIDIPRAEGNMFPFFPELDGSWDPGKALSRLTRWTVDYGSNAGDFESAVQLSDFVGEFPRTDDRYQMSEYRHGWLLGFMGSRNSLAHVDLSTGRTQVFDAGPDAPLQEPCFIPRRPGAPEGDGYIVQVATRAQEMRTDVLLFDALSIADGPMATIRLPIRLRPGYHGSWADGGQLGGA